jgi:ribose-phosphate pyrophosphokinase
MFLNDNLKIFSGSSNPALTVEVCKYLGLPVGGAKISTFPDGEKLIRIEDDVRGRDCFVVQSTCKPVDEHLVELLIYLDCLRRASAKRITAVTPYFGYARQDRKDEGRVPITAKLVANLLTTAGADRVLAIDLHAHQLQGFFDIPVDHLTGELVLSRYFRDKRIEDLAVVSPDVGNIKTAARYAAHLGGDLAIVHKKRISGSQVQCGELIGSVDGCNVLMCDDIIRAGEVARRQERPRGRNPWRVRPSGPGAAGEGPDRRGGRDQHDPIDRRGAEDQEDQGPERGRNARRGHQADSQG